MSAIKKENSTFGDIYNSALDLGRKYGYVSEILLQKRLHIAYPTSIKVLCAMECNELLGEQKANTFAFEISDEKLSALKKDKNCKSEYIMLVENVTDFKAVGMKGYLVETLLLILKITLNYGGSLSVAFIQRKLGISVERATEIFDVLDAIGFIGDIDELNQGRRTLAIVHKDFDALVSRVEARKW